MPTGEPCTTEWSACISAGDLTAELVSGDFEGPGPGSFAIVGGGELVAMGGKIFCNRELVDRDPMTPVMGVTLVEEISVRTALFTTLFEAVLVVLYE